MTNKRGERRMTQATYIFNGLNTLDAYLGPQTAVECCHDGLALRHGPSGMKFFIPTVGRPEPGCKVVARDSLQAVCDSPLIAKREFGGGALHVGLHLARLLREAQKGGAVHLFNSGTASPGLADLCTRMGLTCHSLARHASSCPRATGSWSRSPSVQSRRDSMTGTGK
jgi:hypothetical protein